MLTEAPDLVYLSWDHLSERREDLKILLGQSNVAAAVREAPSVLLEPYETLEAKVKYCFQTMHASPKSVAQSGALAYNEEHLR